MSDVTEAVAYIVSDYDNDPRVTREEWIAGVNRYFDEKAIQEERENAVVLAEWQSVQTVIYDQSAEINLYDWEQQFGTPFDPKSVTIADIQEFVGWQGINESGGEVVEERTMSLEVS